MPDPLRDAPARVPASPCRRRRRRRSPAGARCRGGPAAPPARRAWSKALTDGKVAPTAGPVVRWLPPRKSMPSTRKRSRVERAAGAHDLAATSPAAPGRRLKTSRPAEMPPSATTTGRAADAGEAVGDLDRLEPPAEMQLDGRPAARTPRRATRRRPARRKDRIRASGNRTPRAAGLRLRQASRLLASAARGCGSPHPRHATGQPCGNSSVGAPGPPWSWHRFGRLGPAVAPASKGQSLSRSR